MKNRMPTPVLVGLLMAAATAPAQKDDVGQDPVDCNKNYNVAEVIGHAEKWTKDKLAPVVPNFGLFDESTSVRCNKYGLRLADGFTVNNGNLHYVTRCFIPADKKSMSCVIREK